MQVLGIVGETDSGTATLVERLVERCEGRVATVEYRSHPPDVGIGGRDADGTVALTDEGGWVATGDSRSLTDTLDALAPDYDYAVVEGYGDAAIPKVALGDRAAADPVLARFDSAEDADLDTILDALAERDPYATLETLVQSVKRSPDEDRAGAIATFTGRVRAKDGPEDRPTERLEFERYDAVAQERMADLRAGLEARDGVHAVRLHHKTGAVEAGEDIVFVVVLAGHRAEAFAAVQDGIDRLKAEVPLFKKEVTVDGEFWAHERESD